MIIKNKFINSRMKSNVFFSWGFVLWTDSLVSDKFCDLTVTETPLHPQHSLWIVLWDPWGRGVRPSSSLFTTLHKIPGKYWCAVRFAWNWPTDLSDVWEDERGRGEWLSACTMFSLGATCYRRAGCLIGDNMSALTPASLLISSWKEDWSL